MKKSYLVSLLLSLGVLVSQGASFLDGISVSTIGLYRADISKGGGDYGAGVDIGLKLNPTVTLNVRNLAYEHNKWGDSVIDETHVGVIAQLFKANKDKLTISGEADYVRQWETKDNGIGVGGRLSYNFTKNISTFAGIQYRIFNKGNNDFMFPFGINFKF
jgi:hypothetical protein